MKILMRRVLLRIGLCVALVLFGFFLARHGMRHTIVFDNCEATRNDVVVSALEGARVTAGGQQLDVAFDDRAMIVVAGSKVTIVLETLDASGSIERRAELPIELGLRKMFVLSLPLLAQGATDPFLEE